MIAGVCGDSASVCGHIRPLGAWIALDGDLLHMPVRIEWSGPLGNYRMGRGAQPMDESGESIMTDLTPVFRDADFDDMPDPIVNVECVACGAFLPVEKIRSHLNNDCVGPS